VGVAKPSFGGGASERLGDFRARNETNFVPDALEGGGADGRPLIMYRFGWMRSHFGK